MYNIYLFVVATVLLIVLFPVGLIYACFKFFTQGRWQRLGQGISVISLSLALGIDKIGNVILAEIMNDWFIKKEDGHRYGDINETISFATGINVINNTLTEAGWRFNSFLDFAFGRDHAVNAVKIRIKKNERYEKKEQSDKL